MGSLTNFFPVTDFLHTDLITKQYSNGSNLFKINFAWAWDSNYLNTACDLNCSVRGRVSSSRTSFWTPPNLNSEVSRNSSLSWKLDLELRRSESTTLHTIYSFKNYNFLKSRWNHKNWKLQQIILIKIYDTCA